jgi:hypothetical protein
MAKSAAPPFPVLGELEVGGGGSGALHPCHGLRLSPSQGGTAAALKIKRIARFSVMTTLTGTDAFVTRTYRV